METGNLDPKIIDDFFPKYKDRDGISLEQLKDSNTYRSYFDYDHTHDIWDSEAKKLFDRGDFEEALTRQHKAMDALDKGMNPEDAAPIRESYARKCDVYTAYEHVSRRDVSPEDAQKYLRVFLDGMTDDADRSIDFLARLYDATGDERKASLVRTDPWNDFSQYLEQFDRVKDTFEDNEKGFFYSNAIVAYERKISSIKKGV